MSLRRRIALWLDPTLDVPQQPIPEPIRLDLNARHYSEMADALERIAKTLHSIDRKTAKRRPRVIECQHPELHPELEAVA